MKAGQHFAGHPVNVATGVVYSVSRDFSVSGRIDLTWERAYSTALLDQPPTPLGPGWTASYFGRLTPHKNGLLFFSPGGYLVRFSDTDAAFDRGEVVRDFGTLHEVRKIRGGYVVTRWEVENATTEHFTFLQGPTGVLQLTRIENSSGDALEMQCDDQGRLISVLQRRERRRFSLRYSQHLLDSVALILADGSEQILVSYEYDVSGRLTRAHGALGGTAVFEYDAVGRITRETLKDGAVFLFEYDPSGRCIRTGGSDGYDEHTLRYLNHLGFTDVADSYGNVRRYQWNESGQVLHETSPSGKVRSTKYDEHGRIIEETTHSRVTIKYNYDDAGNRSGIIHPNGSITKFVYNERRQLISITDGLGGVWNRSYDSLGQVIGTNTPTGNSFTYRYNERGDIVAGINAEGQECRYQWDAEGNLISATDWLGKETRYEYSRGWLAALVDPLGHRTEFARDLFGRIREVTNPDASKRTYTWNAADYLTESADEMGAVTRWHFGTCGRLVAIYGPTGGRVRFHWGRRRRELSAIVNELGESYTFAYDEDGRLSHETDFAGRVRNYEYYADGHVAAVIEAAGRKEFTWTAAGLLARSQHDDGSWNEYEYDGLGRVIKAANADCLIQRKYDAAGNLAYERQDQHEILSDYSPAGNRVRRTTSFGDETTFEWTPAGRLKRVIPNRGRPIELHYDEIGDEVLRAVSGGVRIRQSYDGRRRLAEQTCAGVLRRRFHYDAAGNLTSEADDGKPAVRYRYDGAGRIISAQGPGHLDESVAWDAADNPKAFHSNDPRSADRSGAAVCEHGNMLLQLGATSYAYDGAGRLASKSDSRGETRYIWNGDGKLVSAEFADRSKWEYRYDAFGRRIRKTGPAGSVDFVWDRQVVLYEIDRRSDELPRVTQWEFEPDGYAPIARIQQRQTCLCANGVAGNPRELITANGRIAWSANFGVFGALNDLAVSEVDCPVRFPGQWFDSESGLHYNTFRYYDPAVGRYISPDPIGLLGSLNGFLYAPNTSGWVDPLGLDFYRGAPAGQPPSFQPRPGEYKVDKNTGMVQPTHGVSVFNDPAKMPAAFEPHRIDPASVPDSLQIKQRGKDPAHFEIMPKEPMTVEDYKKALSEIKTEPAKKEEEKESSGKECD